MGNVESDLARFELANASSDRAEAGKEEWVAEKAMEVRESERLMRAALEWDACERGSVGLFETLATWGSKHEYFEETARAKETKNLKEVLAEIAEEYAREVLFPAHLSKLRDGWYL